DPPRAEPGTTPIVPSGALQRRQDRARRDLTDTRERLEQSALLERDLLLGGEMLQHTPAADAEAGALRLNAVRRCTQQARGPRLVVRRRGARSLPVQGRAGQAAVDEAGLAVDVCDPPTRVIEIRDLRSFRDALRCLPSRPQQSGSRHAARNSWKCGFGCARSA